MANAKEKTTDSAAESMNFSADVARLLEIVAHALYSNRDVFLRELISNSADACDRLRYEAIENPKLIKDGSDHSIRISHDTDVRTVTVTDNGIGMDKDEMIENLGTIAHSGTSKILEKLKESGNEKDKLSLIGQFGVGFYASFMVSDRVQVISRKAGTKKTWLWESDGKTGFHIREATGEEAKSLAGNRGTAIILYINDDSSEYLIPQKLQQVILTYSDHIDFPIYLGQPEDGKDEIPVNRASALWSRSPSEISDEEYTAFYQHIGHGMDEPMHTAHWTAEGMIEFTALLYLPTLRPWDLYDPTRRHSVRLYVKRIFITDDCENLMFPWLRFVRGVIDSKDLPLNISREMLQHNPVINKIRSTTARRILKDLKKLAEKDPTAFATFWGQFGAVLKEGLYDAAELREEIFAVTRFYSTHKAGTELTSLEDYIARMPEDQDEIYYISGENLETLKNSPQLEGFKDRGLEVLFFTDTIDDFWLQNVRDFKSKTFKSVTKGSIDLSRFENKDGENSKEKQEDKKESESTALKDLIGILAEELKDEVGQIRMSSRLTSSPVCLVAADNEVDLRMERVLKIHQKYEPQTKRVLEINPDHDLIIALGKMASDKKSKSTVKDAAHLLLDQARIIQGEPVPDPSAFAKRMADFMARGLKS